MIFWLSFARAEDRCFLSASFPGLLPYDRKIAFAFFRSFVPSFVLPCVLSFVLSEFLNVAFSSSSSSYYIFSCCTQTTEASLWFGFFSYASRQVYSTTPAASLSFNMASFAKLRFCHTRDVSRKHNRSKKEGAEAVNPPKNVAHIYQASPTPGACQCQLAHA